jgi:hypothetical protein
VIVAGVVGIAAGIVVGMAKPLFQGTRYSKPMYVVTQIQHNNDIQNSHLYQMNTRDSFGRKHHGDDNMHQYDHNKHNFQSLDTDSNNSFHNVQ